MKKILLSIFWIITLWLINFSSAFDISSFSVNTNSYWYYTFDLSSNNIDSSINNILCVSSFSSSISYFALYWLSSTLFSDYSDLPSWNNTYNFCIFIPSWNSELTFEVSSSITINFSILSNQNTPSTPTCSSWSCTVSSYQDIVYSWTKTITQNSTTNIIDFWSSPNKTMCITLEWTMWNQNYVKLWFNNNATSVASDSQEYWYDQVWKTVCLYANKRYFNINNPKSTNPELFYQIYFLNDLLNESVPCDEDLSCQSDLTTCQWNLSTCQWMYDRLETDFDLLEWNYNSCTSDLNTCLQNWWSSWSGNIQWSSLFINNNQVLWNKNVYFNIPELYQYSYNNEWENAEIEVVWIVQDEEYLLWVINKLNYIPTTEDLSNVFSNLGLFGSLLVVCLFVILVFYMIKKIFE